MRMLDKWASSFSTGKLFMRKYRDGKDESPDRYVAGIQPRDQKRGREGDDNTDAASTEGVTSAEVAPAATGVVAPKIKKAPGSKTRILQLFESMHRLRKRSP